MTRRAVAVGLGALVITTVLFVFANTAHAAVHLNAGIVEQRHDAVAQRQFLFVVPTTRAAPVVVDATGVTTAARTLHLLSHERSLSTCAVSNVVVYGSGKRATFTVAGDCVVSLVSYERHGNGLASQTLFDFSTKEFSCGSPVTPTNSNGGNGGSSAWLGASSSGSCSGELRITVPDCAWQADLVLGQPRNPPTDYGNNVLGFRFGGEGQCPPPSTTTSLPGTTSTSTSITTTTITPTSVPGTTREASSTSTPTVLGTTTTPRSTHTDLAHTGSNSLPVIALGALGLIGAGRYVERRGKRREAP